MNKPIHYEFDILLGATSQSACGVYSDRHLYSRRERDVTCKRCLKALGYKVAA